MTRLVTCTPGTGPRMAPAAFDAARAGHLHEQLFLQSFQPFYINTRFADDYGIGLPKVNNYNNSYNRIKS